MTEQLERAKRLATRLGFANSCSDDVGALLRALAATARRACELGTGCGVGTAWAACGLPPDASLVTVELDASRAAAARELFRDDQRVRVLTGDWRTALPFGPYDLIFADGGAAKDHVEELIAATSRGGVILMDDLTDPRDRPGPDGRRERWLRHPAVAACLVGVGDDKFGNGTRAQALIAVRR